jgi:hypothetical protein
MLGCRRARLASKLSPRCGDGHPVAIEAPVLPGERHPPLHIVECLTDAAALVILPNERLQIGLLGAPCWPNEVMGVA